MKSFKLFTLALLAVFAGTNLLSAADDANDPNNIGRAKAYLIKGDVKKSFKATPNDYAPIARGADFLPGDSIKTGADGNCMLVFSNGAAMQIQPNSSLTITQFTQDPFNQATQGTFMRLKADPSKSTTRLKLNEGTLAGEVKTLNVKAGSQFNIDTPAGSAGIRGTVVKIAVVINGVTIVVTAQCTQGTMVFTPLPVQNGPTPSQLSIPAGSEQTVNVTAGTTNDADGNPVLTSMNVDGTAVDVSTSTATIAALFDAINQSINDYNEANPGNPIPNVTPPPPPTPTPPPPPGGDTPPTPTPPAPVIVPTNPTVISQ